MWRNCVLSFLDHASSFNCRKAFQFCSGSTHVMSGGKLLLTLERLVQNQSRSASSLFRGVFLFFQNGAESKHMPHSYFLDYASWNMHGIRNCFGIGSDLFHAKNACLTWEWREVASHTTATISVSYSVLWMVLPKFLRNPWQKHNEYHQVINSHLYTVNVLNKNSRFHHKSAQQIPCFRFSLSPESLNSLLELSRATKWFSWNPEKVREFQGSKLLSATCCKQNSILKLSAVWINHSPPAKVADIFMVQVYTQMFEYRHV